MQTQYETKIKMENNNEESLIKRAVDYSEEKIKITFIEYNKKENRLSRNIRRIHRLRKAIKDNGIDIVISFITSSNFLSIIAAFNTKAKVFVSERSNPNVATKKIKIIRNLLYRFADGCVFQTKDAMNVFNKRIRKKSTIIGNPSKNDLPMWNNIKNHDKTIITACRLEKSKNLPMLLNAFSIANTNNSYKLLIYGNGPDKDRISKIISDLKLNNSVSLMGEDKSWHKNAVKCSVFVLSSDYEGMSNSLLEALSMGIPVISTDHPIGGAKALIEDEKNGFLVPVGDSNSMAKRIIEIMNDENLQNKFSRNALIMRDKYSIEKITDKWLDFVNK